MLASQIIRKFDYPKDTFEQFAREQLGAKDSSYGLLINGYAEKDIASRFEDYMVKRAIKEDGYTGLESYEQLRQHRADEKARQQAAAAKQQAAAAKQQAQIEAERLQKAASVMVTSSFNFEGYSIKRYSGYISGDDVISVARGTSTIFGGAVNAGEELSKALAKLRRNALQELKEAAVDLDCNAVIAVDFDYITLDP